MISARRRVPRPWGQLMELPRRQFLRLASGAAVLPAVSRFAWGQAYPPRPVHVVVGFPAGNNIGIVARLIVQWLPARLGRPFVSANRREAVSNQTRDGDRF